MDFKVYEKRFLMRHQQDRSFRFCLLLLSKVNIHWKWISDQNNANQNTFSKWKLILSAKCHTHTHSPRPYTTTFFLVCFFSWVRVNILIFTISRISKNIQWQIHCSVFALSLFLSKIRKCHWTVYTVFFTFCLSIQISHIEFNEETRTKRTQKTTPAWLKLQCHQLR